MKQFIVFLLIFSIFFLLACSNQNPTNPSQKTYELIVINPHWPLTFNIFLDEEFIGFIDTNIDSGYTENMGKFPEHKMTHFKAVMVDSPFIAIEDTIISTINCDSVVYILCNIILFYYE